jgi:hypothetical protein
MSWEDAGGGDRRHHRRLPPRPHRGPGVHDLPRGREERSARPASGLVPSARGIPVLAFGGYPEPDVRGRHHRGHRASRSGRRSSSTAATSMPRESTSCATSSKRTAGCWAEINAARAQRGPDRRAQAPAAARQVVGPARRELHRDAYGELIQVELDALPPDVLKKIYEDGVCGQYWDSDAYDKSTRSGRRGPQETS